MTGNNGKVVILQDRDLHLLRELSTLRVIDREHAKVIAKFGSTTRANARLLALTNAGFLRRYFWGTVGGARKALYSLSARGAERIGVPYRRPRRGRDEVIAVDSLAAHQLAVNEVYCTLKYRPVRDDSGRFVRWASFQEPLAQFLIPDGYAEMQAGSKVQAFFIEVDLGTESRIVWEGKTRAYLAYAASGKFTEQFGQPQFRTLTVTTSESRLTALRIATAAITQKIFRFTTFDRINRQGLWADIWQKPTGDERQTLL